MKVQKRAPLVGRSRELEQLTGLLVGDRGGLALVSGEAGIGKTRLLEELVDRAAASSRLTLVGRAAEYERELPFGLVIDAVDPYLESLDSRAFGRLAQDRLGDLASVFPALYDLGETVEEPTTATERFRIHNAVRDLLERLAARQPILVVLEDVHWADGASLELITHLIRRPPQADVALALSFRTGQADPAILRPVQERGEDGTVSIELEPLDLDEAARLLGVARSSDVTPLQRESGGNPFYLLQLAQGFDGEVATDREGGRLEVPPAVRSAINLELDTLEPHVRRVAEVAAVVGDPFEVGLVREAYGASEAEFLPAFDDLAARQLIRAADTPRQFAFRHPLVRTAIYESAPPGSAIATHRRVAEILMRRGEAASEIAHHVERSADHGDSEAIEILRRAAEENATRAPTSAARWLRVALELLPGAAEAETRRDLLVSLGTAEGSGGELDRARETLERALALTPPGDAIRAPLVLGTVGIEQLTGRQLQAKSRLEQALASAQDEAPETRVALMIALGTNGLYLDERDSMYTWGTAASEEALRAKAPPSARAHAHASHALGAAFTGQVEDGLEQVELASALVAELKDDELSRNVDAIGTVAAAELYLDRYEDCLMHAERGMRIARATGQGDLVAFLNPTLGTSAWVLGRFDRSMESLDAGLQGARLTKNPQAIAWAAFNRAVGAMMAGDLETALPLGEESVQLSRDFTDGLISSHAGVVHAGTLLELGEPQSAIDLMTARAGGEELTVVAPGSWRCTYLEILCLARLALGRVDEAASTAELIRGQAANTGLPIAGAVADRASASVALARGDAKTAAGLATASIAKAESAKAWPAATTCRVLAGRALLEAGDSEAAVPLLEQAATDHEEMGSIRYRDQAEALLRKAGVKRARKSRRGSTDGQGITTLTGRELEVAELIRDRRTNKEIATELFLSLKTVESHIRNIFGKLDVSSRVEVARLLDAQAAR